MTQAMSAARSTTIIAMRDDQLAPHDSTTQQMIDRIVTENVGLLERLRDA